MFVNLPLQHEYSRYWTEDKNLYIQKAKEKTGLDKRTLSAAKKGQLERGHNYSEELAQDIKTKGQKKLEVAQKD